MNPPSPEFPLRSIRAFVWDLADDHLDDILSRLHDHGISGLHAALAFAQLGGGVQCLSRL